jgi:hypothetical protein
MLPELLLAEVLLPLPLPLLLDEPLLLAAPA